MTMTGVEDNGRRTWARRPTPEEVAATLSKLQRTAKVVSVPALVAGLRRETGCSRATAYRAVSDAFAAGKIERADG
jgi:hypothetical protein